MERSSSGEARTSVGLFISNDAVITALTPALSDSGIAVGDRIIEVDGVSVTGRTVFHYLRGNDIVGSQVTLTLTTMGAGNVYRRTVVRLPRGGSDAGSSSNLLDVRSTENTRAPESTPPRWMPTSSDFDPGMRRPTPSNGLSDVPPVSSESNLPPSADWRSTGSNQYTSSGPPYPRTPERVPERVPEPSGSARAGLFQSPAGHSQQPVGQFQSPAGHSQQPVGQFQAPAEQYLGQSDHHPGGSNIGFPPSTPPAGDAGQGQGQTQGRLDPDREWTLDEALDEIEDLNIELDEKNKELDDMDEELATAKQDLLLANMSKQTAETKAKETKEHNDNLLADKNKLLLDWQRSCETISAMELQIKQLQASVSAQQQEGGDLSSTARKFQRVTDQLRLAMADGSADWVKSQNRLKQLYNAALTAKTQDETSDMESHLQRVLDANSREWGEMQSILKAVLSAVDDVRPVDLRYAPEPRDKSQEEARVRDLEAEISSLRGQLDESVHSRMAESERHNAHRRDLETEINGLRRHYEELMQTQKAITSESSNQVERLQQQVDALRSAESSQRQAEARASDLERCLAQTREESLRAQNEANDLRAQLSTHISESEHLIASAADLRQKMIDSTKAHATEVSELRKEVERLQSELALCQNQNREFLKSQDRVQELEDRRLEQQMAESAISGRSQSQEAEVSALRHTVSDLTAKLEDTESCLQMEVKARSRADQVAAELRENLDKLRAQKDHLQDALRAASDKNKTPDRAAQSERIRQLEESLGALTQERDVVEAHDRMHQMADRLQAAQELRKELVDTRGRIQQLEAQLHTAQHQGKDAQRLESTVRTLEAALARRQRELSAAQAATAEMEARLKAAGLAGPDGRARTLPPEGAKESNYTQYQRPRPVEADQSSPYRYSVGSSSLYSPSNLGSSGGPLPSTSYNGVRTAPPSSLGHRGPVNEYA